MKKDWLWDRKIGISKAREILKNPNDRNFVLISSLLLSRKHNPQEVFKEYIDPALFCKYWQKIKRKMRQDKWSAPRIVFWQAIYEKLLDKYRKEGIQFIREKEIAIRDEACEAIGKEMRRIRKEEGMSQAQLAQKAGISQQLISRVEKGQENISLITLKKISKALARRVEISFL